MIPAQMHRLATRLGMRDGEAYTVVCGLLVAIALAAVGLPGVLRGFDPGAAAEVAVPRPSSTSARVATEEPGTAAQDVAAALPALAPTPRPAASPVGAAPASRPSSPGPATPSQQPSPRARSAGDLAVLAELPEPGAPDALAVGPDGTVYVAGDGTGRGAPVLWALSAKGALLGSWAAPARRREGGGGLTGVAVDPRGTVWVTDAATATVLRLDRAAGMLVPVAVAADLPACGLLELRSPCERGVLDSAPLLLGIASAPDGSLVVADRGQGVVWALTGTELSVLAALDDRVPGDGPLAVSFLADDELVLVTGARRASFPPGLPAVLLVRLRDDQPPEAPVVVTDLDVGEVPGDVVAGATGRVYVSIPSTGAIADIGVDQGDRIDIGTSGGDAAPSGPTGLALRPRSLLVSDTSARLFDLAVDDRPVTRGPT